MSSNSGNAVAPAGNPVMAAYDGWASTKPFVTRSTCIGLVVFFLLGLFLDLESLLSNSLRDTVYRLQIYRVFTSALTSGGFINLIFGVMALGQLGATLEYSRGTARFMALMATLDVAANIAFLCVALVLSVVGQPDAQYLAASGFWNVLMPLMAIECMTTPDQPRQILFLPCRIPSKFYPLALFGLLSLLGGLRIDMALGLLMGYAWSAGRLKFADPSNTRIQGWENGCLRHMTTRGGYIVGTAGQESWVPVNNPGQAGGRGNDSAQQRQRPAGGGRPGGTNNASAAEEGQSSEWVSRNGGAVTAPSVANKKAAPNAFAGTGQALGGSTNQSAGSRFMSMASAPQDSAADIASARAARLAALENRGTLPVARPLDPSMNLNPHADPSRNTGGSSSTRSPVRGGNAETSSLLASTDHERMLLLDMGYSHDQADEALSVSGGDLTAAVAYLSSN